MNTVSVHSEVLSLKSVLLHTPGNELDCVSPQLLGDLLFEDIPWLQQMQREHTAFVQLLQNQGVGVLQFKTLLEETLALEPARVALIKLLTEHSGVTHIQEKPIICEYLQQVEPNLLATIAIEGVKRESISVPKKYQGLLSFSKYEDSYYISPLPNLYFTRDIGAVVGDRFFFTNMYTAARKRESLLMQHIVQFHPRFSEVTPLLQLPKMLSIEGGDILHLSANSLCIGNSLRTSKEAIEVFARELFLGDSTQSHAHQKYKEIFVIQLPEERRFMHLDTLMTLVDHNRMLVYPKIKKYIEVFSITPVVGARGVRLNYRQSRIPKDIEMLSFPQESTEIGREQWNDGFNTLAISPGKVITYNRNTRCNDLLCRHGVEVLEIESSELVRGRGGPHCMSLPLHRV